MAYTFQWGNSRQYDRRGGEKAFKKRLKQLLNLPKNTLWAVKRVPGKAAECAKGSKQALLCQKPVDPEPPAGFMNKVTYKLSTYGSFAVLVCFFMTVGYMTVPIWVISSQRPSQERGSDIGGDFGSNPVGDGVHSVRPLRAPTLRAGRARSAGGDTRSSRSRGRVVREDGCLPESR